MASIVKTITAKMRQDGSDKLTQAGLRKSTALVRAFIHYAYTITIVAIVLGTTARQHS